MRWLFLLFMLIVGLAQSKEPSPAPAKLGPPPESQPAAGQEQAAPDQNVTINSPVEIKLLNIGKTPEEAKQEAEDRKEKSSTDRWLIGLTAVLGFVAFLQLIAFVSQARYMRGSLEESRLAGENTRRQTQAFIAIESPVVAVLHEHGIKLVETNGPHGLPVPGRDPVLLGPIPTSSRIVITVNNVGRSPARISAYGIRWDVSRELPAKGTFTEVKPKILLPVDGVIAFTITDVPVILTKEQRTSIEEKTAVLWVHGYVTYQNILNEPIDSPFRVHWDETRGFVI